MKSPSTIRNFAIAIGSAVLLVAVGVPLAAVIQDGNRINRFIDLQVHFARSHKPISLAHEDGGVGYTCTASSGFVYTAPTREDLRDVCSD